MICEEKSQFCPKTVLLCLQCLDYNAVLRKIPPPPKARDLQSVRGAGAEILLYGTLDQKQGTSTSYADRHCEIETSMLHFFGHIVSAASMV